MTEAFDENTAEGNVISTTPKAESKEKRGSVIRVVVSKGKEEKEEEVKVPKIKGLTEAEAKAKLKSEGLESGTARSAYSDTVEGLGCICTIWICWLCIRRRRHGCGRRKACFSTGSTFSACIYIGMGARAAAEHHIDGCSQILCSRGTAGNNLILRNGIANMDQALVIFAAAKPKPNFNLLDRFLILMQYQKVPVIICFNKQDMAAEGELGLFKQIYEESGCQVHFTSAPC